MDPFPYRVGKVRLANPGWLNGEKSVYDPRSEFEMTEEAREAFAEWKESKK